MSELFLNSEFEADDDQRKPSTADSDQPLAARMRPRDLSEVLGQAHLLAEGKLLYNAIQADCFSSILLYGPPGSGKTTLASVIAKVSSARFETLNGVESNVAEIRKRIEMAEHMQRMRGERTILFIDEIHRFSKSQQDVLLPHLEKGTVRFIGATTHNPYFYVNAPLVSRSQVFQLEPIDSASVVELLKRALEDQERGFGAHEITFDLSALQLIADKSDGDARKALSTLELAIKSRLQVNGRAMHLSVDLAQESLQQKHFAYDATGDDHYDTISAFIKSIRGSDPDAAVYWLAKMLEAGEDPRYIARRLIISASEDIGLADSNALRVAMDAQQAFEAIGMPEGRIPLAHATVYLATAPKSNSSYAGNNPAMNEV